jgi:hypothetical protein
LSPETRPYLANVQLDRDLLLEFFLTFARFEYALKVSDFVTSRRPPSGRSPWHLTPPAEPDWRRYAGTIDLAAACEDPTCSAAIEFLKFAPPLREVFLGESIGRAWDGGSTDYLEFDSMEQVLELVRRIRNNLFHGGKFEYHAGAAEVMRERNELLLRHGLAVLHRCLALSPAVAVNYGAATL